MSEPLEIVAAIENALAANSGPLTGLKALVTAGPTHEPARSRALHRQPFVRQAGVCHRACARAGRRGDDSRVRSRRDRAAAAREAGESGNRAGNARGLRKRPTRRYRRVHGGRRRLAAGEHRQQQDEEARRRLGAGPEARAEPRTSCRPSRGVPHVRALSSASRRKPTTSSPTPKPSSRRRTPTGSSPTMCRLPPASWAATATRCISSRAQGVEDWPQLSKRDVGNRLAQKIADALKEKAA